MKWGNTHRKRETTVRKWTFGQEPETNESPTRRSSARLNKSSINALSSSSKQTLPEILKGLTLPSGTPEESENSSDLNYDLEPPSQSTIYSTSFQSRPKQKVQLKTKDDTSSSSGVRTRSSDTEQRETNDSSSSSSRGQTTSSGTEQCETNDDRLSNTKVQINSNTKQHKTNDYRTSSSDTERHETNDYGSSSSEVETSSDTEQRETNDSRSSNSDVNTNKRELSKIIRKNNMAQDDSCRRRATPIKTPNIQSVESPRRSTRLDAQLENVKKGKIHEKRKSSRMNLSNSMSEAIERDKEGKHQDKGKQSEPLVVNDRRRRSKYDTDTLTNSSSDVYVRETDKDVSDDTSSKKNTSQGKTSHRKDLNSSAKITKTYEIYDATTEENISPERSRQSQKKNTSPQKSMQLPRKNIIPQKSRQSTRKNVSPQKFRQSTRKNIYPQKSRQSPKNKFVYAFQTSSSRQHKSIAELPVNISHNKVWKTQMMERESDRNDEFVEASCKDSAKNVQIPMTSMDDIEQNEDLVESNHLFSESDVGCQNNSAEDIFNTTDEQIVNNRTSSVDDKDGRKRRTEAGAIMLPSPPKKHKIGHKSNFVSMVIDEAETDQEHAIDGQDKKYNDIMQHGDIEVDSDINEHGRMQHGDIEVDRDINEHDRMQHGDIEVDRDINEHGRMQHGDIEVDCDINEQIGEKRLLHSSKDNKVINSCKTDEVEGLDDDKSREVQDLSNETNDVEIEDLDDDKSREVQDLSNKTMYDEIEDKVDDKSSNAENLRNDKNDEVADLCNDENGEEGEITTFCTMENVQDSHDDVDDSVSPDLVLVSSGKTPFGKAPVKNVVKKKAKRVSDENDSVAHGQTIRMLRGQERTARDVIDLDIVFDSMTSTIKEKSDSCDHRIKKPLKGLLAHTRKEFADVIDCIEDLKIEKRDKTEQRREMKDLRENLHEVQQKKKSVMKKIEVKKDEGRNKLKYINQWLMSMTRLMKTKKNIRSPRKMEYVTYGNFPDI